MQRARSQLAPGLASVLRDDCMNTSQQIGMSPLAGHTPPGSVATAFAGLAQSDSSLNEPSMLSLSD